MTSMSLAFAMSFGLGCGAAKPTGPSPEEKQAAANRTRAQKLLRRMEKQGLTFGSDEDREQELFRLASLSDEAFAATETAYERMAGAKPSADAGRDGGAAKAGEGAPAQEARESKAATAAATMTAFFMTA